MAEKTNETKCINHRLLSPVQAQTHTYNMVTKFGPLIIITKNVNIDGGTLTLGHVYNRMVV